MRSNKLPKNTIYRDQSRSKTQSTHKNASLSSQVRAATFVLFGLFTHSWSKSSIQIDFRIRSQRGAIQISAVQRNPLSGLQLEPKVKMSENANFRKFSAPRVRPSFSPPSQFLFRSKLRDHPILRVIETSNTPSVCRANIRCHLHLTALFRLCEHICNWFRSRKIDSDLLARHTRIQS